MHCSRLLRRGAVCALLLFVARLISSSLVLDSIPPMQQYFRVVRGPSSVLDGGVNSSAVPVIPSVSSEMSETGAVWVDLIDAFVGHGVQLYSMGTTGSQRVRSAPILRSGTMRW